MAGAPAHIGRQAGPVDLRETVVMRAPHGI